MTLQPSSTCSEGWWDQETSAKVKGVNLVFQQFSLLVPKLREEKSVTDLLKSQPFLTEDTC